MGLMQPCKTYLHLPTINSAKSNAKNTTLISCQWKFQEVGEWIFFPESLVIQFCYTAAGMQQYGQVRIHFYSI